jgi:hypothetical protein
MKTWRNGSRGRKAWLQRTHNLHSFVNSSQILQEPPLPHFFFITNMGVFQGLAVGSICPSCNCSCTNWWAAANFSLVRGHWSPPDRLIWQPSNCISSLQWRSHQSPCKKCLNPKHVDYFFGGAWWAELYTLMDDDTQFCPWVKTLI